MSNSPKSLLQIVNEVQGLLGLPKSTSVINNTTDPSAVQLLSIGNEAGEELRDWPEGGWKSMMAEFNIVVMPPVTTTGNTTQISAVITNIQPNTTGIVAGAMAIVGNAIPQAARVLTVNSSSSVTMTMEATGSSTAEAVLFCQDTYALPSDYKYTQNRTQWDRTNHWELLGPDSPQMDQWHRSGIVATGPRRHFRQIGHAANQWRLWPPPAEIANPLQVAFEYLSTDWVNLLGAGTSTSASWQNDTDTPYLDDRALIKTMLWKYQMFKGLSYITARNDASDFIKTLIARDGAAPTIYLAKRIHSQFLSPSQIVDGNYPGPIGPNTM